MGELSFMNPSTETHDLKELAEDIRKKINGSSLFMKPIDMDNTDAVIIAAYYHGKLDAQNELLDKWLNRKCS
jgi:hypothetical protein